MECINERRRVCSAAPPIVTNNRTPPPPSQKHHFPQKHQNKFCDRDYTIAPSRREGADAVPKLKLIHYGTSNCKPEEDSGIRE